MKEKTQRAWNSTLPARRSPLRAKKPWKPDRAPIERKAAPKPRTPIKRTGKKTKAWESCRAKLKERFQRAGITVCEARFGGCWYDDGLGFAHSKKRRNIGPGELEEVALMCNHCHDIVEAWSESMMTNFVREIIRERATPV